MPTTKSHFPLTIHNSSLLLGAHMSIAGGLYKACERAAEVGCSAIQIFTKNQQQWRAPTLLDEDVEHFKRALRKHNIRCVFAHDAYLINLATPNAALWERSLKSFIDELKRCERLGLAYLVTHPGSSGSANVGLGIRNMVRALDRAHHVTCGYKVRVLLEITAGQGNTIGYRFEHLREIIKQTAAPERLGICFDTCHVFAAGYDLRTKDGYERTMEEFDAIVGLDKLEAFHLNDSKKGLGSRVDRHEHIGKGMLGIEPFRCLMDDARFRHIPMVLETPKENDMDAVNLNLLRSLRKKLQ